MAESHSLGKRGEKLALNHLLANGYTILERNWVTGKREIDIIAEDGDALTTAVDKAAEAGVAVLAYDRLIKSPNIAAYLSFNNTEVGRQQGLGGASHL